MNKIKVGTACGSKCGPCRHDWEVTALVNTADYFTGMYIKIIAISLLNINCENKDSNEYDTEDWNYILFCKI